MTEQALADLPVSIIENRGQADPRVGYYVHGARDALYFTSEGLTLSLGGEEGRWTVEQRFVGAPPTDPVAGDRLPGVVSYFKGSSVDWQTGIPTYASVAYRNLWPGIDVVYSGTGNRFEYDLMVRPGADPSVIRMAYRGATGLALTASGGLEVTTPARTFREKAPYAYQEIGGNRIEVSSAFDVGSGHSYGFRIGDYDPTRPLVIDPVMLVYAGYVGGLGYDDGRAIAVDASGSAYVTGRTTSTQATFPVTGGPDTTFNGGADAFVAKVNPSGTGLVYAGYIGGSGEDRAFGIAVDASGSAYITGETASTEATFPATGGPDTTFNGIFDAFVAKVAPDGTGLEYAGYIGGSGDDRGFGIDVDSSGSAYVSGHTNSTQATFPAAGGPDVTFNGNFDAFVANVAPDGTGLVYAGYIGGAGFEERPWIAVDASGSAYVSGYTTSPGTTFPVAGGPDTTQNGGGDAFVAKVAPSGTGLVYAGYIGGSGSDVGWGIAVDSSGSAYVTGRTTSTEATFPVTGGPDSTFNGGAEDAFVAKVEPGGTGLVYAGYIGGAGDDLGLGIAVDASGSAYVTGQTFSTEATFPAAGGPDTTYNGGGDAFVAQVAPAGTGLLYAGYIGGSGFEVAFVIAVDASGSAYVTGRAASSEATFPVTGGPDTTFNQGPFDVFVAKVSEGIAPAGADLFLTKADSPDPVQVEEVLTYTLTVTNGGPEEATAATVEDQLPAGVQFVAATASQGSCTQAGGVVTCSLGSLANGASATVTVEGRATAGGTLSNTAEVEAPEPDPNPGNNSDTETTTVIGEGTAADLSLTKADSPDPVQANGVLTYTLTVSNGGPDDATAVTVEDQLPAGVQFASATASQGTCTHAGGVLTCSLGSLANGASATVTIEVRHTAGGSLSNTAEVEGAEPDPNPGNNSDTETTTVSGKGGPSQGCKFPPCP